MSRLQKTICLKKKKKKRSSKNIVFNYRQVYNGTKNKEIKEEERRLCNKRVIDKRMTQILFTLTVSHCQLIDTYRHCFLFGSILIAKRLIKVNNAPYLEEIKPCDSNNLDESKSVALQCASCRNLIKKKKMTIFFGETEKRRIEFLSNLPSSNDRMARRSRTSLRQHCILSLRFIASTALTVRGPGS